MVGTPAPMNGQISRQESIFGRAPMQKFEGRQYSKAKRGEMQGAGKYSCSVTFLTYSNLAGPRLGWLNRSILVVCLRTALRRWLTVWTGAGYGWVEALVQSLTGRPNSPRLKADMQCHYVWGSAQATCPVVG